MVRDCSGRRERCGSRLWQVVHRSSARSVPLADAAHRPRNGAGVVRPRVHRGDEPVRTGADKASLDRLNEGVSDDARAAGPRSGKDAS